MSRRLNLLDASVRHNNSIWQPGFIVDSLLLPLFIFIPRLLRLDAFLTPDEPLFLDQARQFALGLTSGNLSLTLGIGYPGVTVAWLAAPVVNHAATEMVAYAAGRYMVAMANGLLLLLLYALARRLWGRWPAFIGVSLLAFDPFTLGFSRLLHNDALLALLMSLAGLSLLLWLQKTSPISPGVSRFTLTLQIKGWGWLLLSGLFTGLALLTKSTALVLGPMLLALLIGWVIEFYVTGFRFQLLEPNSFLKRYISGITYEVLSRLPGLIVIALMAALTFFLFWPAMWTQPLGALGLTFGKLLTDQEAGVGNFGFFWMGRFVQDPGPFFYPVAFALKATPWLVVGLIINVWLVIIYKGLRIPANLRHTLSLWLFALTYLILMTIASKKATRYLLPALPTLYLLAGLSWYQMGQWVNERIANRLFVSPFRFFVSSPLCYLLLIPVLLLTLLHHPYYLTYHNPLVLGWLWAPQAVLTGWGEGLDEAARYLNQKPPGSVSAWYDWLFKDMYHGQILDASADNLLTADYAVLYLNQVQRDIPNPNLIHYFRTRRHPEYTVHLNGIDYAWVYPGPVIGSRPDPTPQFPLTGEFGGEARLLGYDISPQPLSGQPLIVTLYWQALATPPADRFVYLRLVDDQGRIWAKADSPPVMGLWPVTRWQPGQQIEDAQELLIPPGTPPGLYRLELGWYDPITGQPLPATGQPPGPGGGLLLGQVPVGWQALTVAPKLSQSADARLAPNARLVGYESLPTSATTGDVLSIRLAWREAGSFLSLNSVPNNYVMFEWRQNGQAITEQLDPLPLPIEAWGRSALLLSQHEVIVPPNLENGRYDLTLSLHTGSDPAGAAFTLGSIQVAAPPHSFNLPASAQPPVGLAQLNRGVTLAGYQLPPTRQTLNLTLYWQPQMPLSRRYKIFVQLLDGNYQLMAQSDSFPAAGQRPTTGWLPGEIITDTHTLTLPAGLPSGPYRLIAGLYDPLTGQRLSLLNGQDQLFPNAIQVAELTLP